MHVRIDAAGKCEKISRIENLLAVVRLNIGRQADDFSMRDGDIETIHRGLGGTHHAGVLDHKVKQLFHSSQSEIGAFEIWVVAVVGRVSMQHERAIL
ncbi:MAG: hypothetical protein ACJ8EJ_04075, partial [Xanthobacteraceae bacterium]